MSHTVFPSLHAFFDHYADYVHRQQTRNLLALFAVPCVFMDGDQTQVFTSVARLEGQLSHSLTQFRKVGIHQSRPSLWMARPTTPQGVLAKVNWDYYDEKGSLAYRSAYQYLLRRKPKGPWHIELVLALEEKEAFEAWLKRKP